MAVCNLISKNSACAVRQALAVWVLGPLLFALTAASAAPPQRIISASPNVTEILYGVGAFDRVVAVSDYCTYPPAVKNLPHIGKWQSNNLEAVVGLRPDLVILTKVQAPFQEPDLQKLGIHTLVVPTQSLEDVFTAIDEIGRATGHEAQAQQLATSIRKRLDAVRNQVRGVAKRRVLFVVDRSPGSLRDLYVATKGSYLAEIIELAGGESIAAPVPTGYGKITKEAIVALAPDVILDMVHGAKGKLAEDSQAVWRDLPELRAVREHHIYTVDDEFVPHASQFVADTAELFVKLLHPELQPKGAR
jgi:iron complex transport system substrate-binding protein